MPDFSQLDQPVHLGKVWAGISNFSIPIIFARTGGGYLNCVDPVSQTAAVCTGFVRRWDARRRAPVGQILSTVTLTEVDPVKGKYLWDWLISDTGSVPVDPGIYVLQVDLLMPDGHETFSQQALIEAVSTAPLPF